MASAAVTPKQTWIALLLNFFLPGVGHIYAGAGTTGAGLLIGNILGWVTTPILIGFVPVFGTWIYSLVTSERVCAAYNDRIHEQERQVEGEARARAAGQVSVAELVDSLHAAHQLLASGMINHDEFAAKKMQIFSRLSTKTLVGDSDRLLLALAPLRKADLVTADEVEHVKRTLVARGD